MANLFDALLEASDEDYKNQIATYKIVTINNIMKLQGNKAYSKVADVTNFITGIFTDKKLINQEVPKALDVQISEYVNTLNKKSRRELQVIFIKSIMERLNISGKPNLEKISNTMVDIAAHYLRINDILNYAQKIDAVYQRYSERIEEIARKQYEEASPEEQDRIKKKIDECLETLSDEERKQIHEALNVENITSETVINVMKTTGITGTLITGGSMFGSYILLSVVLHGVFTTLLGITLPFAVYTGASSLLSLITGPVGWTAFAIFGIWQYLSGASKVDGEVICQTIFLARHINKVPFNPSDDDLPSWINFRDEVTISARKKADEEHKKLKDAYQNKFNEIIAIYDKYEAVQVRIEKAYSDLEDEKAKYIYAQNKISEYERLYSDTENEVIFLKNQIRQAIAEKNASNIEIDILKSKLETKDKSLQNISDKYKSIQATIDTYSLRKANINDYISHLQEEAFIIDDNNYKSLEKAKEQFTKNKMQREKDFKENFEVWLQEKSNKKYVLTNSFVRMGSELIIDIQKELYRVVAQIKTSIDPTTLGQENLDGDYKIPTLGGEYWLIYSYTPQTNTVNLKYFGNRELLEKEEKIREENNNLNKLIIEMREKNGDLVTKLQKRSKNKLIKNAEIKMYFNKALNEATSEIDIFSPWLGYGVVNDVFKNKIGRLLSKGVIVKIRYGIEQDGYKLSKDSRDTTSDNIADQLRERFKQYSNFKIQRNNSHAKLMICDNNYYIITSFNFLSFKGEYKKNQKTRGEIGEYSISQDNIIEYRQEYFNF